MASGYQSVSAAPIDSALWHGTLNEIIVSSVSASLKFYFTRAHMASLQWQGFAFRGGGGRNPAHPADFHICNRIAESLCHWWHMENVSFFFFRPTVSPVITAVNYSAHASVHWWRAANRKLWLSYVNNLHAPPPFIGPGIYFKIGRATSRCTSYSESGVSPATLRQEDGPGCERFDPVVFCIMPCGEDRE